MDVQVRQTDHIQDARPGLVRRQISQFWEWYERHYAVNVGVASFLFALQLVHLSWLSLHVVAMRLTGTSYFPARGILLWMLLVVDMLEMPALVSVSLVYLNELRKKPNARSVLYLVMLNSQWIHIIWITDEYVVNQFASVGPMWPVWLAWVAIAIDYLELPVMVDTLKRFVGALTGRGSLREVFREGEGLRRRRYLPMPVVYCPGLTLTRVSSGDRQPNVSRPIGYKAVADEDAMCCEDAVTP